MLNHHFTTKVRSDTFIYWKFAKVEPQISSCLELKYETFLADIKYHFPPFNFTSPDLTQGESTERKRKQACSYSVPLESFDLVFDKS